MISHQRTADRPSAGGITRPAVALAALETVAFIGAFVWVYVAVIAMIHPERLMLPLVSWLPIRRDTLAFVCFALSVIAYFVRECRRSDMAALAAVRTLFPYSTAVVVYLLGNSITHPATMDLPLSHMLGWPTERTTLLLALGCSVSSFFILRARAYISRN